MIGLSYYPYWTLAMLLASLEVIRETGACGMYYWEPEGAFCFSHYALSAWDDDGTPGIGMQAYQEICLEGEPK